MVGYLRRKESRSSIKKKKSEKKGEMKRETKETKKVKIKMSVHRDTVEYIVEVSY